MKLVSFEHQGQASYGIVEDGGYRQAPAAFRARYPDLVAVLADQALPELAEVLATGERIDPAQTRALPVIPRPGKFLCVGLNYRSHVAETKRADSEYPALFVRFADSLCAAGDTLPRPAFSERFDWEGELAVVIGKGGRNIDAAHAWDHIAGYAGFNDVTVRDWQRHTHQWTPGKNFPGTGAFGPWLVTADEVGDVGELTLQTRVNGEVMQQAPVSDLIFTIPTLIAYISQFTPLSPGDVIATGTPGGVGDRQEPPRYLREGDTVEVEITRLGTLRNVVGTAR